MKLKRIIILLAASCLSFMSCNINHAKNIKDCSFRLNSISELWVNNISFDGKKSLMDFTPNEVASISKGLMTDMPIIFTANITIDNPNNQKAELSALEWILLIKDVEVANGTINEKIKIGANQSISLPIDVETNTSVLKKFSLAEIKSIIFNISSSKGLPQNSTLKVKPAIKFGSTLIKSPNYFTINVSDK
ncbi:MAG: LEA type 2 family protein [Bacteroidales bacterium]|nr:LEA type 2 family protein [Bacteroidales bacterium]